MKVVTVAFLGGTRTAHRLPGGALGAAALLSCLALAVGAAPAAAKAPSKPPSDRALIDQYAEIEGAHLKESLPGGPSSFIEVVESAKYSEVEHQYGKTFTAGAITQLAYNSSGSELVAARITVFRITHSETEALVRAALAHEVFHVYEGRMSGSKAVDDSHEGWLVEGAAEWVESELVPGDRLSRQSWGEYLKSPGRQLFKRSYDGVGFFGHMISSHINPWLKFKSMFAAAGSPAAYAAAVGGSATFLDNEASVFFREPALGSEWDQAGRNVPSAAAVHFSPGAVSMAGSSPPRTLSVKPYADGAYVLSLAAAPPGAPVVELTVASGSVRLRSTAGGSVDSVNPRQLLLCTDAKGCSCPTRSIHYERFERGNLAITGGPTGGRVKLVRRRPCEVLLHAIACHVLLPGFTIPVAQHVEPLVGPLDATSTRDGNTVSTCALLAKGREVSGYEGETRFVGVLAPFASVLDASSAAGAERFFRVISGTLPPGYAVTRPEHVGEEAVLLTKTTTNAVGEAEYGSIVMVRVQNIVAQISLVSTPGDSEADPANSLKLLERVARTL